MARDAVGERMRVARERDRKEERRFLRRLKQRDEAAFTELVRRYQHPVFSLVMRMMGNAAEAQEVCQEVFVSVFRHIDSFRGDSSLSTWLYRIATNHCKNRLKYLGRRGGGRTCSIDGLTEGQLESTPGPTPSYRPDQVLEGRRTEQAIQRAIAELSEEHRLLIVLRDIQGLSYQEIGRITGLASGTVKSRLHRARLALKERIEPWLR